MTIALDRNQAAPQSVDPGSAADWRRAAIARHNMLVDGTEAQVQAILRLLTPYLRQPVIWLQRGISQALPAEESCTLVMQNIAALDRQDQLRLRVWLDDATHRRQVVSTSAYPLFPLVDCGVFDATLYYRLSLVRVSAGQHEHGAPRDYPALRWRSDAGRITHEPGTTP
jgi:hypothetical protein